MDQLEALPSAERPLYVVGQGERASHLFIWRLRIPLKCLFVSRVLHRLFSCRRILAGRNGHFLRHRGQLGNVFQGRQQRNCLHDVSARQFVGSQRKSSKTRTNRFIWPPLCNDGNPADRGHIYASR